MENSFNNLLNKLEENQIDPWLEEMKLGKPIYDQLFAAIGSGRLTQNQICNGLQVLFRLRHHSDENAYFNLLVNLANSDNKYIRSTAIKLLIGLLKLSRTPGHTVVDRINDPSIDALIRKASEMGLNDPIDRLAKEFLSDK